MPRPKREKTIAGMREDDLVAALTRDLPTPASVQTGVGDDCAVVRPERGSHWTLFKTDAVVEGVHFDSSENYRRVGWKALCRPISDIAAMSGVPAHALITIAVPPSLPLAKLKSFYAGLRKAAAAFGVAIVGGETARSPGPFFCSVALAGHVEPKRCLLRSGGAPGDALFVTGLLGGSLASGKHLDFTPRLKEARWLTERFRIHAMMDLSDGLASDLPRLAEASGCGYCLAFDHVPRRRNISLQQALGDGEDFELLFSLAPSEIPRLLKSWKEAFPKLPLTCVGVLTRGQGGNLDRAHGFDHFA